jgi:hypothetical protein
MDTYKKMAKNLLIKEHAWDRNFGEPLLTLKDVTKKHTIEKANINEANESTWTWIYKGMLSGFKKADNKGDASLDAVARAAAFLLKTEFGPGSKNDFMKSLKKYIR